MVNFNKEQKKLTETRINWSPIYKHSPRSTSRATNITCQTSTKLEDYKNSIVLVADFTIKIRLLLLCKSAGAIKKP